MLVGVVGWYPHRLMPMSSHTQFHLFASYTAAMKIGGGSAEDEFEILKAVDAVLSSRPQDPEVAYRALVAVGTLVSSILPNTCDFLFGLSSCL